MVQQGLYETRFIERGKVLEQPKTDEFMRAYYAKQLADTERCKADLSKVVGLIVKNVKSIN